MITTGWHSGYGDTPLGIYESKNIHMLKSYPRNFQVCKKKLPVFNEHGVIAQILCYISNGTRDNAMF